MVCICVKHFAAAKACKLLYEYTQTILTENLTGLASPEARPEWVLLQRGFPLTPHAHWVLGLSKLKSQIHFKVFFQRFREIFAHLRPMNLQFSAQLMYSEVVLAALREVGKEEKQRGVCKYSQGAFAIWCSLVKRSVMKDRPTAEEGRGLQRGR